jgi:hypothetical protein
LNLLDLEHETLISQSLRDNNTLPLFPQLTVIKDNQGKEKYGKKKGVDYFFFLMLMILPLAKEARTFSGTLKTLINASVLGLIFEK